MFLLHASEPGLRGEVIVVIQPELITEKQSRFANSAGLNQIESGQRHIALKRTRLLVQKE